MPEPIAFIIHPFADDFDDVLAAIKAAVEAVDPQLVPRSMKDVKGAGRITPEMQAAIEEAVVCIADVTGANPNVMWEVGYATALRKPVVVIGEEGQAAPFDIQDLRALRYDRKRIGATLRGELEARLRATLETYGAVRTEIAGRAPAHAERKVRTVAVTGTMSASPVAVSRRLGAILKPFLGRGVQWSVGSYGTTDKEVLELLVEAGEAVTVVGHNSYDVSGDVLALLHAHDGVPFVDASEAQIPPVPGAPTDRDVLLAAADLVVVAWDGTSHGARQLIDWLQSSGKDHLVAYVAGGAHRAPDRPVWLSPRS